MSSEGRCCGGRCASVTPFDLNRRDFLERLAAAAAISLNGQIAWADDGDAVVNGSPHATQWKKYPLTPPRVYRGQHLQAVAMPLGGIGTGSIWLDGHGKLSVWQIFNNLSEPRVPDSFFAVRAKSATGAVVTRVLQTEAEGKLRPVESIEYEGGYPIARLAFHDAELPVEVSLEAMNPLIPLDTANSSIPCALFRLTARNPGTAPVEVTLFSTLQNAVGNGGAGGRQGVRLGTYGGNENRTLRRDQLTAVAMSKSPDPVATGPLKVRTASGKEVAGPELFWQAGLADLTSSSAESLARIAEKGGVVLAEGVSPVFFETLARFRSRAGGPEGLITVFEDFEGKTFKGWTITGDAFGTGPSHGTEGGQQPVTGFSGHGLVNTFISGDDPQGTATSKHFRIERRYIGFLIGGGNKPGKTCINLRVEGKVVRTATGKDLEALEPASWDVSDLKGRTAVLEIVDRSSEGWGHINIDQIVFSDVEPDSLLRRGTTVETTASACKVRFTAAHEAAGKAEGMVVSDTAPVGLRDVVGGWRPLRHTRLQGFRDGDNGYKTIVSTASGDPLIIQGPLGKGRIILVLADRLPWSIGSLLLAAERSEWLKANQPVADAKSAASREKLVPGNPHWGTMALAAFDTRAFVMPAWKTAAEIADFVAAPAANDPHDAAVSGAGETINAAIGVPLTVPPGESRSVTFAITWDFPNADRFGHPGNLYSRRSPDAAAVAKYLAKNFDALWQRTELYHSTLYQSNLPEEFIDAMAAQSVILRGPTCFWSEDGYFGGFEGSYGCCPLNCTHVWNYAQSHARLFPDVARNMRVSNFITFLHPSGETSHREHAIHPAFIDGHCACIEAAYREYQLSADRKFLEKIWPGVKKAVDWLIGAIDAQHEGVPHGNQANTYDSSVSGANTFIGSQYLSALAAAERMATLMKDAASHQRWHAVRQAGMKHQNDKLWNGEFYIQIPEPPGAQDYDTGCHADQLLGQWWAHMLNLGYLYPPERVKSALSAVMEHNFRERFAGFKQMPRRYIPDDEGGLIICTWPNGGRPKDITTYSDEVWTGIEYAFAGALVYEGLVEDARRIVKMTRSRYDGRLRDGLDSGPGGNPFNDLECGKFYARAMSSWSLLVACQGLLLEGPIGLLGFHPRWQPEDHRSFFTAPEGWGLFIQSRSAGLQSERIEVRHGRLRIAMLEFALPSLAAAKAIVTIAGQAVTASLEQAGHVVRLLLAQETTVVEGATIDVEIRWGV